MSKEHFNPPSLFQSLAHGFSQAVSSGPGRTVYISGQTAWNAEREIVGGNDLERQTHEAFRNLKTAIEEARGTIDDIVAIRIYVVNYDSKAGSIVGKVLRQYFNAPKPPASTWVGVQALASPDFLIEIEAVAVIE
ncbi:MAG TPA: RidA family protein [Bacteroidetes bacterium]|nr:RidA family protein [Bacteroidota bacterium]